MKTKIQIKSIIENILFEFEKENNSIKDTLEEAINNNANLSCADLRGADLRGANLSCADLRWADLCDADLRWADLCDANLRDADLKKLITQTTILPDGDLIIWKKLKGNIIAKLLVPTKAKRINAASSRKCRFEYAQTIAMYRKGKKLPKDFIGYTQYDFTTSYKVGEITKPDKFDPSPLIECSNGIHGFITKQEAIDY